MRLREAAAAATLLLATGCATSSARAPGLPGDLIRTDPGTLTGVWHDRCGLVVTIDLNIRTFAAQKNCTLSGGALVTVGPDRFRIDRYETGYSTDRCGPWRNGPAIAPFDGTDVRLVRTADRLVASNGNTTVTLDRVRR